MNEDKLLVLGPAWVGDMMMAQSLLRLLKQNNPNLMIDVLALDYLRPLLTRMPEINQIILLPVKHGELGLSKRYRLGRDLRVADYHQAIVLPNSFKSALVPFFAGIQKRTGWRGEWRYGLLNDLRVLDDQKYTLMIERFMALGLQKGSVLPKSYPLPKLVVNEEEIKQVQQKYHVSSHEKPILAICPGGEFGPSKRWPPEYFAKVAQEKIAQGWQVWLFGSKKDQPFAESIMQVTKQQCHNFVGKTNLAEAIDLLSLARVVLTNDSGLMHISAALGVAIVAVYGSTSPDFTPPLSEKAKVLRLGLECSPCFKRDCPLKHWKCMSDLKPELVLKAIDDLLIN